MTESKELLSLSYSGMNSLHSCPKKARVRMYSRNGNVIQQQASLAADAGKAMHEAIQHWFVCKDRDLAMMKLIEHYPYEEFLMDTWGKRSIEACAVALDQLIDSLEHKQYELVYINNKPAVELAFQLRIDDKINYRGFIDLVLWDCVAQQIVVCDIKTKDKPKFDVAEYSNDTQCTGYRYVLEKLLNTQLGSMRTMYMIVNLNLTNPYHEFVEFDHSEQKEQEWLMDLAVLYQMHSLYEATKHFPRRGTQCMNWNRRCEFFDYCSMTEDELKHMFGEIAPPDDSKFEYKVTANGLLPL